MIDKQTYTDLLTDLRAVLGIEYPKEMPECFFYDPYYSDLLADSYFFDGSYKDLLTRSFTAGFLFGVLTESTQDYTQIIGQMDLHSSDTYSNVVRMLVGLGQTEAAEMLENSRELAFMEYTSLTYQPVMWQDEPLDKTMKEIIMFFQLGFEKGFYNLFD